MNDCTEQFVRDINRILDEHDHSKTTVAYALTMINTKDGEEFTTTMVAAGGAYAIEYALQQMIKQVRESETCD